MTDRPINIAISAITEDSTTSFTGVTTLTQRDVNQPGPSTSDILKPEDISNYFVKLALWEKGGRKPGRTRILTDTPEGFEMTQQVYKIIFFKLAKQKHSHKCLWRNLYLMFPKMSYLLKMIRLVTIKPQNDGNVNTLQMLIWMTMSLKNARKKTV